MDNDIVYELPKGWESYILTPESIADAYTKLMQFPILFDDSARGDFEWFVSQLIAPSSVVLKTGNYGMCRLSDVVVGRDAIVHLAFWDKRFHGRLEECQQAIRWAFWQLNLARLSLHVPEIAKNTQHFVKLVGFKREGVMRNTWLYKGKFMNLHAFGMLREESLSDKSLPVVDAETTGNSIEEK